MLSEQRTFWMVWNPEARAPTFKHPTRAAAAKEAERLALMFHGETFYVLEAVEGRIVPAPVLTIPMRPDAQEEIPF